MERSSAPSRDRQHGIAAAPALGLAAQAALGRQRFEGVGEIVARRHLEGGEPAAQAGLEAGQARAIPEIDEMQGAAGQENFERLGERLAPGRDHRERVGNHHAVEARMAEQFSRLEARGVAPSWGRCARRARRARPKPLRLKAFPGRRRDRRDAPQGKPAPA